MHRLIVALGLIAVTNTPAAAQTTLGLRGGVGFATVAINADDVEEESRTGMIAGVDIGVPVSDVFGFRFGGSYVQKGGGAKVDGGAIGLNFDYIQFSALARVGTPVAGGFSVGVTAGPWAAYRLSCDVEATFEGMDIVTICNDPPVADFDVDAVDYGLAIGGGIGLRVSGSVGLVIDALYSFGLAAVVDDEDKTRNFTVQTGIVFPIG